MSELDDRIGLAEYLTSLRAELSEAQSRASGDPLKLGVEQVTVALDIAYTLTKSGEASGSLKAKFWVLELGVGAKGTVSASDTRTQRLTLTLKPRVEEVITDQEGRRITLTRGVDVAGQIAKGEESPKLS